MLDDVAFGSVLEQPARKGAPPLAASMFEHQQLHERARFMR
jgi:hypothetical protein